MTDFQLLTSEIIKFRDDRDWAQFHNPKDLSLALSIEAAELNELFLWKTSEQAEPEKVKEELADVLTYAFMLAYQYGFDIPAIVREKLQKSSIKYPVDKAKGKSTKYDQL